MKSKTLWFKQIYVSDILSGKKDDTYRKPTEEYQVGQTLLFSVGPRKPFAQAIVTAVTDDPATSIAPDRLSTLQKMYGNLPAYRRITFKIAQVF